MKVRASMAQKHHPHKETFSNQIQIYRLTMQNGTYRNKPQHNTFSR